jgi:hypothetical protein
MGLRVFHVIALAAALCFGATIARAQSDFGTISGFVKDASGSVVPNASVTVSNQAGLQRMTASNEAGYYTITNIPSGIYTLTVEAQGFKKYTSLGNKLDSSSTLSIEVSLVVGAVTETVEVTASATALQTESGSVQELVTRQQIDALELNGRNPVGLASLVPGARGGNLASLSFAFSQGPSNFNGSRNQENLITYDGAPATRTRANGTSLGSADVDSTQEVQILTAAYAAEYGRSSGAQIRILTKSGSSQFHGAAYEYVRNNIFNANTWTRNHTPNQPGAIPNDKVAPFRYNQFGYNIGGPFYIPGRFNTEKSKIFWYWGQEWVRYRYTDSAGWVVPSAKMRQGDFSELSTPLKDPLGGVFPNNVIPANRLSQSGLGILKAYPGPNLTTPINGNQNFYATALHPQNQRKDTLAVDFNLTNKQHLQFRRNNYTFWEYQPLDGTPTETPKYFIRPNQTNSLDYVWIFSPTLVNELTASVSIDDVYIPVDTANFLDRTSVGITYPYLFPEGKLIPNRIPTAKISPFNDLNGGPYPSHSSGPIYTLSDSVTWVKGTHTFKFGFYFERSGENDNDEINVNACPTCTNNQNGQFSFTDSRAGGTGSAAANAALGLFTSYSELGQRAYTLFRGSSYEPYAQDSWKVNQKLTINYGFRYTVIVPYKALWRNMAAFDPALYDPTKAVQVSATTGQVIVGSGDRYNGMVIPGTQWPDSAKGRFPEATSGSYDYLFRDGQRPDYFSDIQWGQIQPRVGIAYQLTPKTVIRAGSGRFYTRMGVSDSIFLGGNPPFQPTANVTLGSIDNLGNLSVNSLPLTVTTQSKDIKNPEAWNWNVTVERELPLQSILSLSYVGRRGLHLQREVNINQPALAAVLANPTANLDSLRPYKGYNSIRQTDNSATSRYNSFQMTWNRRFARGAMFGLSYTLSHSTDSGSAPRDIIPNTYDASNLWGNSNFDVTHVFVLNYMYELPFFRNQHGVAGKTLGGWQISGITQFQTGTPCTVMKNNDYAGVGVDGNFDGNCSSPGNSGQLWAINGDPSVVGEMAYNGKSDARQWFTVQNPDGSPIFTAPAKGTFVTQSLLRNKIHNPGFRNFNIGLYKKFTITEHTGVQFRAQAFNAFNHPNWANANFDGSSYNADPTKSLFGKVTGKTDDVRNIQLSLRLYF